MAHLYRAARWGGQHRRRPGLGNYNIATSLRFRGRLARVWRNGCADDCRLVGLSPDLSYVQLPRGGSSLLVGGLPRRSALATLGGLISVSIQSRCDTACY